MATSRKKKTIVPDEVINVYNDERLVSKHDKKQKANKPSGGWPKIVQGSHLTVITYENGRTELQWDDEALLRDVRMALLKAESNIPASTEVKPKKAAPKAKTVEEPKTKRKSKETK